MNSSSLDSLAYRLLVKTCTRQHSDISRRLWSGLHDRFAKRKRTVQTTIHNRLVYLNFGYTYPFLIRQVPNFNAPLLSLAKAMHDARQKKIRIVDIGAAIGDTVLLIDSNIGEAVEEFVCVDGDQYFFDCLAHNTSHLKNIRRFKTQLSKQGDERPAIVMTNLGTASAIGSKFAETKTLDQLFAENSVGTVDVLKVDVDGFDGEVLGGAKQILTKDKPGVIFEWHPTIWEKTNTDTDDPFQTLKECGYSNLMWFNNEGFFSGFSRIEDEESIRRYKNLCLSRRTNPNLHFDVVALPPGSDSQFLDVAELRAWAFRKCPC